MSEQKKDLLGVRVFEVLQIEIGTDKGEHWAEGKVLFSKEKLWSIIKEGREEILLDSEFKILSEQTEENILTLQFRSGSDSLVKARKIQSKNHLDYISWKDSLKDFLKTKWVNKKHCEVCLKRLGLIRRTHHCRKCFKAVCRNCSMFRSTLPELGYTEMVRICLECSHSVCQNRKGKSNAETPNFTHLSKLK